MSQEAIRIWLCGTPFFLYYGRFGFRMQKEYGKKMGLNHEKKVWINLDMEFLCTGRRTFSTKIKEKMFICWVFSVAKTSIWHSTGKQKAFRNVEGK